MNTRNTLLLAASMLFAGYTVKAQDKSATKVPAAVQSAFEQRFPNAEKVEWEMEDKSTYEAEFKMNGTECSANFTSDGTWKETEMEVKEAALPEAVRNTLTKDYADHKVKECERVETPSTGMNYEVELAKDGAIVEVLFDVNGTVVSSKAKSTKDQDDDED